MGKGIKKEEEKSPFLLFSHFIYISLVCIVCFGPEKEKEDKKKNPEEADLDASLTCGGKYKYNSSTWTSNFYVSMFNSSGKLKIVNKKDFFLWFK